jgi:hypothetical protein
MNKEKNPFFSVMWYKDDGIGASTLSGIIQEAMHIGTKSYHNIYGESSENSIRKSTERNTIITGKGYIFSPDQRYKGYHFYVEDKTHSSEALTSMNESPMTPIEDLRMEDKEEESEKGRSMHVFYRQETKQESDMRKKNQESNCYVSMFISMGIALFSLLVFAAAKNAGIHWHYSIGIPLCVFVLGELPMVFLFLYRILRYNLCLCTNMFININIILCFRIADVCTGFCESTRTCLNAVFGYIVFCFYCCFNNSICRNNAIVRWRRRRRQVSNRENPNHVHKRLRKTKYFEKGKKKGKQKAKWQRVIVMDAGVLGDSSNNEEVTVMREIFVPSGKRTREREEGGKGDTFYDDEDCLQESEMIEMQDLSRSVDSNWEEEDSDYHEGEIV